MPIFLRIIALALIFYCAAILLLIVFLPFEYRDIDLNGNSILGLSEIEYVISYDVREVDVDGKPCKDYYALKDGLSIKQVCP